MKSQLLFFSFHGSNELNMYLKTYMYIFNTVYWVNFHPEKYLPRHIQKMTWFHLKFPKSVYLKSL